ncbi:hypothetical protein GCM10027591_12110 [Zhihengliuella somnathii]
MSAKYSPQSTRLLVAQAAGDGAEFYFSGPDAIAPRATKRPSIDSVDALLEREEVKL